MNSALLTFSAIVVVALIGLAATMDYNDAQAQDELYCEMVGLFEADSHLPPEQRKGWPNYKDVDCE